MKTQHALIGTACLLLSLATSALAAPQTLKPDDKSQPPAADPNRPAPPQATIPTRPHLDACQLYERALFARREAMRAPDLHQPDLRDPVPDDELEELRLACLDYVGSLYQGLNGGHP